MDLSAGTRIGPYEIESPVGAGGMGEVYRGRDTRLNRTVAIKVLSSQFSSNLDRLSRFEREARTLASLNHQNIAQIYGTEREADVHALAMEFVDGEDLSQILARGPMPIEDAVAVARQIADALAAAHEHGIVHRDLKPANVKLRADGTVKVLDFGLAKTVDGPVSAASGIATLTSPVMTQMGMILGTAAYMSPEQAKGKDVDRGTDLWAFGAVVYEMLVGRAAYTGETVTDVLAAIVTREPDWGALPAATPPVIHRLLRRCLERDRRRRLADAGEARFQLDEAFADEPAPQPVARAGALRTIIPWSVAAPLAVAVALLAIRAWRQPAAESEKYNLDPPANAQLSFSSRPTVAVSRDGRTIVFVASVNGVDRLFVRRTGSFEATEISGTENASTPAISPDGRSVAFATSTRIGRVSLAGGPVTLLADLVEGRGVSWDEDESILYVPISNGGIWRVPATGGQPAMMTTLDTSANERTHRWPQQLPGGALIFTSDTEATPDAYDDASIVAWMPDGSRHTVLSEASMARYVPPGHLIFARGGTLFGVPFDAQRAIVTGTPVAILHEVAGDLTTGAHHFAVSPSNALVYIAGRNAPGSTVPAWISRDASPNPLPLPPGGYADLRLSPDGLQLAAAVASSAGTDIWVHHLQRRTFTKVTFGGENMTPMWSRDGATLYYIKLDTANGGTVIMRRPADGSRQAEPIATVRGRVYLNDIMPDDRGLIVTVSGGDQLGADGKAKSWIGRLPLQPNETPSALLESADAFNARLSPDRRWIAFTGRTPNREILVRAVSGDGQWQVSTGGGEEPKWSRDGRQLFYRNDNILWAVTVDSSAPAFESSLPVQVLKGIYNLRNESGISYDVAKDQRFLMLQLPEEAAQALSLRLITNWTNELK